MNTLRFVKRADLMVSVPFRIKKRIVLRDMNITFQLIFQDIYHQVLVIEDLIFPKFLGHLNTFDDDKLIF